MISTKNPAGTNEYKFTDQHKDLIKTNFFYIKTREKTAILRQMKKPEQLFYSLFFLFHYGLFHMGYLMAIVFIAPIMLFVSQPSINIAFNEYLSLANPFLWLSIGLFFINHFISYKQYYDPEKQLNLSSYVFLPYLRVIPMHLIIFVAGWLLLNQQTSGFNPVAYTLVILVFLKTIADLIMHVYEHKETIKDPLKTTLKSIVVFTIIFVLILNSIPVPKYTPAQTFVLDNEINACYQSKDDYACFADLAIQQKDYNICKNIGYTLERMHDPETFNSICYYKIFEKTGDKTVCDLITIDSLKKTCFGN